jgi:hypothetical protein
MKNNYNEQSNISVDGHCVIKDMDTGEVLLDKHNAINFQNFAFAVSNLLANKSVNGEQFFIEEMAFGKGGTLIDANGNITYRNPQVDGVHGALYEPLEQPAGTNFSLAVDSIDVVDAESNPYSDITVKVILDYNEPALQQASDNATDFTTNDNFVIDEIALVTESGSFLTHLIFHPIQKSSNRKIEILYSLRIRAGV